MSKPELNLVFDFEAILFLAEKEDLNLMDGGISEEMANNPTTYKKLLTAGLRNEFPDITPEEAIKKTAGIPISNLIKMIATSIKEAITGDESEVETELDTPTSKGE